MDVKDNKINAQSSSFIEIIIFCILLIKMSDIHHLFWFFWQPSVVSSAGIHPLHRHKKTKQNTFYYDDCPNILQVCGSINMKTQDFLLLIQTKTFLYTSDYIHVLPSLGSRRQAKNDTIKKKKILHTCDR